MPLKQQLEQDIKQAMLSGNTNRVTTLRGLKSVILYAEVAQGVRESGLPDDEILALFAKESKKRQESAELYAQGGGPDKAAAELAEKEIIDGYLPVQMADNELADLGAAVIAELDATDMQAMGRVIAAVKEKAGGKADGARIARSVKERLARG